MIAELRALDGASSLAAASGKLAVLDRLLTRKKAQGSRVLLFSQFTLALDVLEEYCLQQFGRAGYLRLDGATNRIDREMDVRSFNVDFSPVFIYLISTRAGGQGINLATADTVVLYDTCWNPQVDLQAEDRAHRIGQRKQVRVYRLISESTMEERILATARQKLFIDKLVIKDAGRADGAPQASQANAGGDGDDDDERSVSELWATLCHGASELLDPAKNGRILGAEDYDAILDSAVERAEDDAAIAMAQATVADADGAAMAGAMAQAVKAAAAAEISGQDSSLVSNYELKAYGKKRLLVIGLAGLQTLCEDRGVWQAGFRLSQAAEALLMWKSKREAAGVKCSALSSAERPKPSKPPATKGPGQGSGAQGSGSGPNKKPKVQKAKAARNLVAVTFGEGGPLGITWRPGVVLQGGSHQSVVIQKIHDGYMAAAKAAATGLGEGLALWSVAGKTTVGAPYADVIKMIIDATRP